VIFVLVVRSSWMILLVLTFAFHSLVLRKECAGDYHNHGALREVLLNRYELPKEVVPRTPPSPMTKRTNDIGHWP
jgi:hypothetical protein